MASSTRIKIALGLFLARSVSSCVATIRPKSGVKPTCQDSSTDAFDVVDGARSRQRAPIG